MHFGTAIVGGGKCGSFAALALHEEGYKDRVGIFERGPILGGAGGTIDGKLNMSRGQGGHLDKIIDQGLLHRGLAELVLSKYLDLADRLDIQPVIAQADDALAEEAIKAAEERKLWLMRSNIYHFGSDGMSSIMQAMHDSLGGNFQTFNGAKFERFEREDSGKFKLFFENGEEHTCDNLVLSLGRRGCKKTISLSQELGVPVYGNGKDIGIRYVTSNEVFPVDLQQRFYELKLSGTYHGFPVRTFCMCPGGNLKSEGHIINGESLLNNRSPYTNVAILVTVPHDESDPWGYLDNWTSMPKETYGTNQVVQTYGDFKGGVEGQVAANNPLIGAIEILLGDSALGSGNMHRVLPEEVASGILGCIPDIGEFLANFDGDSERFDSDHNLALAVEAKYCVMRVGHEVRYWEPSLPGLKTNVGGYYPAGDVAGSRGIFQAALMGYLSGVDIARRAG